MRRILKQEFFSGSALEIAEGLLGKFLVKRHRGREVSAMITEVEAYDGPRDKASHASRGITHRNKIMFGEAGRWYIYFTYGMHWMLNVVTGPEDYPAAVLIRGVEGVNGPGRVTKSFKVNRALNNKKLGHRTGLWIEDRGIKIKLSRIKRTKRVGVQYAGRYWANRKYRLVLLT